MPNDYNYLEEVGSISEYLEYVGQKYKNNSVARIDANGYYEEKSYSQLLTDSKVVGYYLIKNNIFLNNIAIIGDFSYEWIVTYFGILFSGNTVVPIEETPNVNDSTKRINDAEVAMVIISEKCSGNLIEFCCSKSKTVLDHLFLEEIINIASNVVKENECDFNRFISQPRSINPLAMIVFTSGTTNQSKGVMLSHRNILHNVICSIIIMGKDTFNVGENIVPLLPPYHMFEVTTGFLTPLFYGGAICFSKDKNFKNVFSKYTPSALMVVPSILDGFYKQMLIGQGKKHKYIMSLIFISKLLLLVNIDTRGCLFKKIQKAFGGKLKMMVCGGAEVKDEVVKLFDDFGINVLVGYGITECSPIVSCNRSDMKRRGSVGIVVPEKFCEVHILNNEVLVKGTIVFSGYYNNQEATINSFDKGWFRTGDLGYFDKQGFLYIIGRTKNLIVLPDGNKVSPEEIENEFLKSQIVDSILVYEEKVKKGTQLIAAIYPNISNFEKDEIDVLEALNTLKDSINKNNPAYKRISRINVLSAPFETTALGKIKRYKYP